jgi:hypothetical protein
MFIDANIQDYLGITWGGHYGYIPITDIILLISNRI